jgi:hypothetical protein
VVVRGEPDVDKTALPSDLARRSPDSRGGRAARLMRPDHRDARPGWRLVMFMLGAVCVLHGPFAADARAVSRTDLERLIDDSLDGVLARQLPWGGFDDPLSGPPFGYGAVAIGWIAAVRAAPGPPGNARRQAAALALQAGARVTEPGGFQAWIEALAMSPPERDALDAETRAALAAHLSLYRAPTVGLKAQPCFAARDCFTNLELVDAVGSLQLARTSLVSSVPGSRLTDRAALERAGRAFLASELTRAQQPVLTLRAGPVSVRNAALLSDGGRKPLAYHTLTTALLVRALVMLGDQAPAAARLAARRALWALVALVDPRGDVTWMGRGQEHLWSLGATLYAGIAGAAGFARSDARLAARLRTLGDLAFAELRRRRLEFGFTLGPAPRRTLAGMDDSAGSVSCIGLALLWLQLAVERIDAAAGPVAPLPAQTRRATALDPHARLATLRAGNTWLAVHGAATHPRDARYDVGLLAAMVAGGGSWRPVVGQRPNTDTEARMPSSGPALLIAQRELAPSGRLRLGRREIVMRGAWRAGRRAVSATWRFRALADGVQLRTPCPASTRLRVIEWIPADTPVSLRANGITLANRSLIASARLRPAWLPGLRASAAHERLRGLRLTARCTGRPLIIRWRARRAPATPGRDAHSSPQAQPQRPDDADGIAAAALVRADPGVAGWEANAGLLGAPPGLVRGGLTACQAPQVAGHALQAFDRLGDGDGGGPLVAAAGRCTAARERARLRIAARRAGGPPAARPERVGLE